MTQIRSLNLHRQDGTPLYGHLLNSVNNKMYDALETTNQLAHFKVMERAISPGVDQLSGRTCINFGSNDYLGLRWDRRTLEAAKSALSSLGCGSGASPLMCGSSGLHRQLEERLADWVGREEALLFATGYQANLGALSAVLNPGMLALTDTGVHASLIDGCRLAGADLRRFHRRRPQQLTKLMTRSEQITWVISESLYSMEGDMLDVDKLISTYAQAAHGRTGLFIDEAHTLGVFGPDGGGLVKACPEGHKADLIMGTLSKSLGSCGGFIAGSRELIRALRVNARALLFSASGVPAAVGAALATLDICIGEPERRQRLLANAARLRRGFTELGLDAGSGPSQIVPLNIGNPEMTIMLANALFERGIYASVALHPAVPRNKALLRFGVTAAHSQAQIDQCVEIAGALCRSFSQAQSAQA